MLVSDVRIAFGKAVKMQRFELGISQEELADRSGLHRTYISDVERGVRNVSLESIRKLAQALEMSVARLFSEADAQDREHLVEILLVEDNPHDVELTLRAFHKARICNPVHVARDGVEALQLLSLGPPSAEQASAQPLQNPGVILLDLNLPKVDGIEVLRRIKASPQTASIPVVVLTVSSRDIDIAECRRLGAASYIVKPVGFQNFSEVTPHLQFDWVLKKARRNAVAG